MSYTILILINQFTQLFRNADISFDAAIKISLFASCEYDRSIKQFINVKYRNEQLISV